MKFDNLYKNLLHQLNEEDNVAATNLSNIASSNISPDAGKKLIQTFKQSILMPLKDGKTINDLDKNQVQAAINGGLIDAKTGSVSDSAIAHVNSDPDLTGHFLPASDAAQTQTTQAAAQKPAAAQPQTQTQTQSPTTSKSTTKPSTNQAGVVSSVYKIQ